MKKNSKFKKLISFVLSIVMVMGVMSFAGCANKSDEPVATEPNDIETMAPTEETLENNPNQTMEEFIREYVTLTLREDSDVKEILTNIAESGRIPFECVIEDIPADYMPGFKERAEDFTDGAMLAPVMSTQPFIVYLFKTDNPTDLYANLKKNADLRWNICTEATVIVAEEYDNFVLFGLLP